MEYTNYFINKLSEILISPNCRYEVSLFLNCIHYIVKDEHFFQEIRILAYCFRDFNGYLKVLYDINGILYILQYILLVLYVNKVEIVYEKPKSEQLVLKLLVYVCLILIPEIRRFELNEEHRFQICEACIDLYDVLLSAETLPYYIKTIDGIVLKNKKRLIKKNVLRKHQDLIIKDLMKMGIF